MPGNGTKNILVVDDSADVRDLLRILLEAEGYVIHASNNGQKAFEKLNAMATLPDLILLDLRMPVMDGFEFRRLQAADERLRGIPTIVMTGIDDLAAARQVLNPAEILRKPLNISSIRKVVKKWSQPPSPTYSYSLSR